jgi:sugar phosphate isomerase/epimerase
MSRAHQYLAELDHNIAEFKRRLTRYEVQIAAMATVDNPMHEARALLRELQETVRLCEHQRDQLLAAMPGQGR